MLHFCSGLTCFACDQIRGFMKQNYSNAFKEVLINEIPMSQTVVVGPVGQTRAMPPMTWSGTMVSSAETETHYLHLSAFRCERCNGPVIAGFMGTRRDDISQETDIKAIGASCIVCGFKPEFNLEPSADHRFRPVEWRWTIKTRSQPADSSDDPLPAELSQDADVEP